MTEKEETRPRITIDRNALIDLRAFADRHEIGRNEAYGYALEQFAERLEVENPDKIATIIKETQ